MHVTTICIILYVEHVILIYFFIVMVRTVVAGHQMVADGHKTFAQGWQLFEEVVEEAESGDFPQLLWQLKRKMMPTTPPPPLSLMEVGQ